MGWGFSVTRSPILISVAEIHFLDPHLSLINPPYLEAFKTSRVPESNVLYHRSFGNGKLHCPLCHGQPVLYHGSGGNSVKNLPLVFHNHCSGTKFVLAPWGGYNRLLYPDQQCVDPVGACLEHCPVCGYVFVFYNEG